jgi:hypothetical protein
MVFLYLEDELLAGVIGRITDVERVQRLHQVDQLSQEGLTDNKISEELGLGIQVVKRLQKYLKNLKVADLTPEILSEKRAELYLELSEAAEEAREQFELYRLPRICSYCNGDGKVEDVVCDECKGQGGMHFPRDANRFLETWTNIIEKKARLYGLDRVKTDNIINFNTQFNTEYVQDMKLSGKSKKLADKLSDLVKKEHEAKLQ